MLHKIKLNNYLIAIVMLFCCGCSQQVDGYTYSGYYENMKKTIMTKHQYQLVEDILGNHPFDEKVEFPLYLFGGLPPGFEYKESYYTFFKNSQNEVVVQKLDKDNSCTCSTISKEEYYDFADAFEFIEFDELHEWEYE